MSTDNHRPFPPAGAHVAAVEAAVAERWSTTAIPEGLRTNVETRIRIGQLDPAAHGLTFLHP